MDAITIIIRDPRQAEALGLTPEARQVLQGVLSYHPHGYTFDWQFKAGRWNGAMTVLKKGLFPAGLVGRAKAALEEAGYGVTVASQLPFLPESRPNGFGWNDAPGAMRDYQETAVLKAVAAERGVLSMVTGSGKTLVMARLATTLGLPTLIVCPGKEIFRQTAAVLRERLPDARIGLLGDGYHTISPDITVAIIATLTQNKQELRRELAAFPVVMSDEAHHAKSATWYDLLQSLPAPYRFGFSGTPATNTRRRDPRTGEEVEVGEDLLIEGALGPVIYTYSNREAIAADWLTPPTVWMLRPRTSQSLKESLAELNPKRQWAEIYARGIATNPARNEAVLRGAEAAMEYGQTLVIARLVAHGEELNGRLTTDGYRSTFIDGSKSRLTREKALRDFGQGGYRILVASVILDEGVDVPTIAAVVLAAGGRADHKSLQRVGRGMRRGGRDHLLVIDILDDAHPILAMHARQRMKTYRAEGWPVEVLD